jgi:intracellular sulfur oxidation DsrE/DsrF family protein
MKTWVRRSLNVGVLGAGFLLVGGTAAHADMVSGPNAGVASGNQLSSVLQVPVDVSGNAVSVLGFANAQSIGGAGAVNTESATTESAQTEAGDMVSGFNAGLLNGNQVSNVVQVPVSVCGNSIAVLGFANAQCVGGAAAVNGSGGGAGFDHGRDRGGWDNDRDWDDNDGRGQGNGGYGGGQSAGGYGGGQSAGGYGGADAADDGYGGGQSAGGYGGGGGRGASVDDDNDRDWGHGRRHHGRDHDGRGFDRGFGRDHDGRDHDGRWDGREHSGALSNGGGGMVTGYNAGLANGNQLKSVIQAPIDISGNAISLFGFANARSIGGAGAVNTESATTESTTEAGDMVSGFNAGLLNGNQLSSVVQVPVSVCGNSIAVLGFADAACVGGASAVNGGGVDHDRGHDRGWDRDRNRHHDWDNDDDATPSGNYGGPSGMNYGASPSSVDPAKADNKAAKKANKVKKVKKNTNEHSFAGRGKSHNGAGASSAGYNGTGAGGYNGTGAGMGDDNDDNDGDWGRGRDRDWDRNRGNDGGSCGGDMVTGYNAGLLNGNQLKSVVQVPVDISGNSIALLGFAQSRSVGGAAAVNC